MQFKNRKLEVAPPTTTPFSCATVALEKVTVDGQPKWLWRTGEHGVVLRCDPRIVEMVDGLGYTDVPFRELADATVHLSSKLATRNGRMMTVTMTDGWADAPVSPATSATATTDETLRDAQPARLDGEVP